MIKNLFKWIPGLLLCSSFLIADASETAIPHQSEIAPFAHSFVSHYEANITGKFTHEYHPYLLKKTAHSLDTLEHSLRDTGFNLAGRVILMGYEEQGVPRYYADHRAHQFSDEMSQKTNAGWSLKMYNRFGLLTGFLGKDANLVASYWEKATGKRLPITHINPDQVEIFDGQGTLFQEHAFGDAYKPVMHFHGNIEKLLLANKADGLLAEFMAFWKVLYNHELKVSGKQHVVGTQDILFSVSYAEYLQRSNLPLKHFYMGPDITYPIEVSTVQSREQTRHSQAFVKQFVPRLQPVNDKKTAYIFCSFVDGVGKSTMLGNVQNWMKHGAALENYEPVDNSSSQLATVFQFSDDVWIADLPAQVSHFTYKPDGYVFAPVGTTGHSAADIDALITHVSSKQHQLSTAFEEKIAAAQERVKTEGIEPMYESDDRQEAFIANLLLLKKEKENRWVSFVENEKTYLFNRDDTSNVRVLVPLATAPSHGLKNNDPAQMIFSLGVRFPLAYPNFLKDLNDKLRAANVEEVVMVDFLSMYSRSSRENIRVNYVVQQLALLHKDFGLAHSFYQNFVDNAQLLAELDSKPRKEAFTTSLLQEAVTRTVLYLLLLEHADTSIDGMPIAQVTTRVREAIKKMPRTLLEKIDGLVEQKITMEYEGLQRAYGTTREYVLAQQFKGRDLFDFSEKVRDIFATKIRNERIQKLWAKFDGAKYVQSNTLNKNRYSRHTFGVLNNECEVRIIGRMPLNCKDRSEVLKPLREARAMWYAMISNLLYSVSEANGSFFTIQEKFAVPPLLVLPDDTGMLCIVTPVLDDITKEYEMPEYRLFLEKDPPGDGAKWGCFDDQLYLTDWSCVPHTNQGVFAWGHEIQQKDKNSYYYFDKPQVSKFCTTYHGEVGAEHIMPTEKIWEKVDSDTWQTKYQKDQIQREAKQNGRYRANSPTPRKRERDEWGSVKPDTRAKIHEIAPEQRAGAQLCLRLLATLEMIAKDGDADLAARRGNQEDFVGALKLFEQITLPQCYGLHAPEPLFKEYREVQPALEWSYFG